MGTTAPDGIFFPDTTTAWATTSDFSVVASSVQTALNSRQRYDYVWANSSARSAQTGMTQGSRGYQTDTLTEYIYDASTWRPAIPYAEYSSPNAALASTSYTNFSAISINSGTSTSTTFATSSGSVITCTQAGIYLISLYCVASAAVPVGFGLIGIASDFTTNFASQIGRAQYAGDNTASLTTIYRHSGAGGQFYFAWKQNDTTSRNHTATIRLERQA